jgi:iron complex transport system ATP-binding protein
LQIKNLTIQIGGKYLLNAIDLTFEARSWVSVIGPNGAGKTTLVESLSGVRVVPRGKIFIGNRDLAELGERERAQAISFVPQSPVIPRGMSVLAYIALGRTAHQGAWRTTGPKDMQVIEEVTTRLGITWLLKREISSLSGGERQRAVLARALVQEAGILILDEPTAALDIGHQLEVLSLLRREVEEQNICVITTLHDLTLAGQYADRLIVLNHGDVLIDSPAREAIRDPQLSAIYGLRLEVVTIDGAEIVVPAPR